MAKASGQLSGQLQPGPKGQGNDSYFTSQWNLFHVTAFDAEPLWCPILLRDLFSSK